MTDTPELPPGMTGRALPAPEVWVEAARRETGRDKARAAAIAALDPGLHERSPLETLYGVVARDPDQPAIVDAGRVISYRDFWNIVASFTGKLRAADAPAGPVALLTTDNAMGAAALFACIGAGRIFVPLDAASPVARNAAVVDAVGAAIVALGVEQSQVDAVMRGVAGPRAHVVLEWENIAGPGLAPALPAGLGVDEPAFILPTSGSTGQPKLIVRAQRSMAQLAHLFAVNLRADDRLMTASGPPYSYSGMKYLFAPLFVGASLHCTDVRRDGARRYLDRFVDQKITVLRAAPSLLRVLCALPGARRALAGLRAVHMGGEPALHADIAPLRAVLPAGCVIENRYGPTEGVTVHWPLPMEDRRDPVRVPIGFAEPGGEAAILDDEGALCPPGVVGELVLRSRYNALGEWVDGRCVPGRLIPDPAAPEKRVFFTGDLARTSADGAIILLGRKDRMLKINGQRVEPMEVEGAIHELADVVDVIVLPRKVGNAETLVAFVVPGARGATGIADALRERLRQHLPVHMVPSRIVVVDAMPLLANGKVDGLALLAGLDAG